MRIAIRTVSFHIVFILIFAFIYSSYADDFKSLSNYNTENNNNNNRIKRERSYLDFLLFSTTIQAMCRYFRVFPINLFYKNDFNNTAVNHDFNPCFHIVFFNTLNNNYYLNTYLNSNIITSSK
jgi:hypothetical protein